MTYEPTNITASRTLGPSDAHGIITVNAAAGLTLTLPAATGTGYEFDVMIATTVTSNNVIIQVANATDVMSGVCQFAQDGGDTSVMFETAADSDTITMNGSTKGGIKGDRIHLVDVSAGLWAVKVTGSATGTEATPFSAAVS